MVNTLDLRDCVVRPVIKRLGLWSPAAEQLVLATAIHESFAQYLRQLGGGPAIGFWQMEKDTHDDIWDNYLEYRPDMRFKLSNLRASWPRDAEQMATNIAYGCAMCRIHYFRRPEPLPSEGDAEEMSNYWKIWYNTPAGKGTVETFINTFESYIAPLYAGGTSNTD